MEDSTSFHTTPKLVPFFKNQRNLLFPLILVFLFSVSCQDDNTIPEIEQSATTSTDTNDVSLPNDSNSNPGNPNWFNINTIQQPYFFTGLFNGTRITYAIDHTNSSYPAYFSSGTNADVKVFNSGFFNYLDFAVSYNHSHFSLNPRQFNIFDPNNFYYTSNHHSPPLDSLTYSIRYSINIDNRLRNFEINYNKKVDTLRFVKLIPEVVTSSPPLKIPARYRCYVDSLRLISGADEILVEDLYIQGPYQ